MIPYILFVLLELLCYSKHNFKLMTWVMILFSILRYNVGWDYLSYYNGVLNYGSEGINWERYSFIWLWLFSFCNKVNCPHLTIAIPGLITYYLVYRAIDLFCQDECSKCDSILVYILWPFFYLSSFSTIRQNLAIAVGLIITYWIVTGKKKRALALGLFNYFIHPSSLVLLGLFVLKPGDKLKTLKDIFLYAVIGIGILSILDIVFQYLGVTPYLVYLEGGDSFGSKLAFLLLLISTYLILYKYKSKGGDPVKDSMMGFVIVCCLCEVYIYTVINISVIARALAYFTIFLIFVLPYTYKGSKFCFPKIIYIISLTCLFFYYLFSASRANVEDLASSGYVPYQTILFK